MRRVSIVKILSFVVVGAILGLLVYYSPAFFTPKDESATPQLKTGGTSVAHIIMENRWRAAYRKAKGVEVDYESIGSTAGLKGLIDGQYAITFTHAPMSEEQKKKAKDKGGEVVHIPVVLCAVVPVYNLKALKDKPPLRFTGEVLADIFLGKIERWNHADLKKLNEGVDLPDTKITVVHREDSSGTTLIFTDYLSRYGPSETWKEIGAPGSEIKWPVGVGKPRNHGVADFVKKTEGAIGYVDLLHAFTGEIKHGAVQNKDRTAFIHAEAKNMTAALKEQLGQVPDDLTFKLTNEPGKDSYPICGAVWAVCYQNQPAADEKHVTDFLHYVTHEGQKFASKMSYAPLPEELIERVEQKLKLIKAAQ